MNRPEERAYQDAVEIVKAAFSAGGDRYPWINEDRQNAACNFIQKIYDKLLEIASDTDKN